MDGGFNPHTLPESAPNRCPINLMRGVTLNLDLEANLPVNLLLIWLDQVAVENHVEESDIVASRGVQKIRQSVNRIRSDPVR